MKKFICILMSIIKELYIKNLQLNIRWAPPSRWGQSYFRNFIENKIFFNIKISIFLFFNDLHIFHNKNHVFFLNNIKYIFLNTSPNSYNTMNNE